MYSYWENKLSYHIINSLDLKITSTLYMLMQAVLKFVLKLDVHYNMF
jgi:hypothetical protein